jgi:adenosylcobyric acid synthase
VPPADLIILPGSKNTRNDIDALQRNNWHKVLQKHLRYGGKVIGICGGFQMLGRQIHDPKGSEGKAGSSDAFAFLDFTTTLQRHKQLKQQYGRLNLLEQAFISGYEIHTGISTGKALDNPAVFFTDHTDGAISSDNQLLGSYLHGLFDEASACSALLTWAGLEQVETPNYYAQREQGIDLLADTLEQYLDLSFL